MSLFCILFIILTFIQRGFSVRHAVRFNIPILYQYYHVMPETFPIMRMFYCIVRQFYFISLFYKSCVNLLQISPNFNPVSNKGACTAHYEVMINKIRNFNGFFNKSTLSVNDSMILVKQFSI